MAEQPHNYLVPHPSDCTKFYSCQNLGWRGGWIAHLMDCPATTGFDKKLRICNYIKALPRCSKGTKYRHIIWALNLSFHLIFMKLVFYISFLFKLAEQSRTLYREVDGIINAKQTRQVRPYASISGSSRSVSLQLPKAGYLKTNRGLNANLKNSTYYRNQRLNSYEIPIVSSYSSATKSKLDHLNQLVMSLVTILLILR